MIIHGVKESGHFAPTFFHPFTLSPQQTSQSSVTSKEFAACPDPSGIETRFASPLRQPTSPARFTSPLHQRGERGGSLFDDKDIFPGQ